MCSPAGSEETAESMLLLHFIESNLKCVQFILFSDLFSSAPSLQCVHYFFLSVGTRPSLIMQSLQPDVSPDAIPNHILTSADCRKNQKERSKEENEQMDKNELYDIISSPSKDSGRLTLTLSRVKIPGIVQQEKLNRPHVDLEHQMDLGNNNNNNQLLRTTQQKPNKLDAGDTNCKEVPAEQDITDTGAACDDAEIDTFPDFERIERESASERERRSKEVQDKGVLLFLLFPSVPVICSVMFVGRLNYSVFYCRQATEEA